MLDPKPALPDRDQYAPEGRIEFIADLRQRLSEGRASLRTRYLAGLPARRMLRGQARLTDVLLREVWRHLKMPPSAALLAVGGYGRGELFPWSDVDLLVLLAAGPTSLLESKVEELIGMLWDIGLEVGHSVRTAEQCLEISARDVTVQTNLLEARLVCGARQRAAVFRALLATRLDPVLFCQAKQLEQQQRHTRYQESAHNLEPSIKESPGGLRDLHTILWIGRASGAGADWRRLAANGLITPDEATSIARHERFLNDLRIRTHLIAGRREDRLLFDLQTRLAAEYGLHDTAARRASEQLMQRYYRTAKSVTLTNTILLQNLLARLRPGPSGPPVPIDHRFQARNELLEARARDLFDTDPHAILATFLTLQRHPALKGIEAETMRALWRSRTRIGPAFRADPENRRQFMQILREPLGVVREVRRLHLYGVLRRYIPAFGRIFGQMQHDLFHVYTVDEHILRVLRNVRRFAVPQFAHEYPLCSRLISDFRSPELLYLAAIFHDIAKGRGGDHSELGMIDARRFCRTHGLGREDTDLVAWLVQAHLVMSATAQKQDISDAEVIGAFARKVGHERRLTALYILTVADIRGTSPKVWNGWKAKLLEDLYLATRRYLDAGAVDVDHSLQQRQREALAKLALYGLMPDAQRPLWDKLETPYFLRHDPQEIAWHARALVNRVATATPVVRARPSPSGGGLQVLAYVPEQKELFARLCGFFDRIGFSIVDAKVTTTRHHYALDSFTVLDPEDASREYRDLMSFIEHELTQALATRSALPAPIRGRVSRQLKHFPIEPEVGIRPDERGTYQVLSIVAGDRPGLLYSVARVLIDYDVSVHTALINTLGERAEDTFLISGAVLSNERAVLRLEADLLAALSVQ
ncbi:MAG: [protein-PII] uridylyltransferase [Proteobacteria bacterium]|nr:[protein-PII] uridylyltransferase [Burkholderiales bacterium]